MKRLILASACALLAACGGMHGLRSNSPDLSSHTDKNVADYAECVRAKWATLTSDVSVSGKDGESHLAASDKNGSKALLDVTPDGKGAQAIMYEAWKAKGSYDTHFRDAATGCL